MLQLPIPMVMKLYTALVFLFLSTAVFSQQNALDFDNVDDNVTVSNASALIANSSAISLTCWVYPTNTNIVFPDYDGVCGFRNNVDGDFYLIRHTNSTLEARFRNSAGTAFDVIGNNIQTNVWQHFALTYNGTTLTLYQNGISAGSIAASGTISSSALIFYIGNMLYNGTSFYWMGKIDEVSLWNKSLSALEVSCIYNNGIDPAASNLKLYYKFNQGTAAGNNTTINTLTNLVSASYNGTLTGFAKTGTTSNFVAGITTGTTTAESICQGDTVFFNGNAITTSGSYIQTFNTASVCDSIVELTVSINTVNTSVGQTSTTLTAAQAAATYQWLDCNNSNAPINNANQQSYSPTANGIYAVAVTYNGCTDTSSCITFNSVGVNENDFSSVISLSPNPVTDHLKMKCASISGNYLIEIIDVKGRVVISQPCNGTEQIISTDQWYSGYYIIKVISNDNVWIKRIVKK
jgi:hypothetical protein